MRELSLLVGLALALLAGSAHAEFAEPPDARLRTYGEPYDAYCPPGQPGAPCRPQAKQSSTVRLSTGPAARLSASAPMGGLVAALDIGRSGAGIRASGAWVGAGSEEGLSQYGGELWLDFGVDELLHPVASAGAAVVVLDAMDEGSGQLRTQTLGAGVVRAGLAYLLPVSADARASIDATLTIPAIQGSGPAVTEPWLLVSASVGIGF